MRRLFLLFILLGFSIQAACQYRDPDLQALYDSETVARMKENVSFFASRALEGRAAGSDGEREAAAYFASRLSEFGVDVLNEADVFGIRRESGDTLTSLNVIGYIPGYDKKLKDRYILIGARLDGLGTRTVNIDGKPCEQIFPGANSNASGLAVLLELARMLQRENVLLRRSVILCAFGSSLCQQAGSWYFLNRSFPASDKIDAMINLDMLGGGTSNSFYAYTGSDLNMTAMVEELSGTLQPVLPQIVPEEPVPSDHRSFYDRKIPFVMFTTGMYPEYNTTSDVPEELDYPMMEREVEYLYHFAGHMCNYEKKKYNVIAGTVPYADCDWKPSFLGTTDLKEFMKRWVYVYLRYPEEAVSEGKQGKVLVDFVIDENGKVTDVEVARGVDPLLDAEAVRIISASPDWKPGRVRGQKVRTSLSLYVEFRLQKRKR